MTCVEDSDRILAVAGTLVSAAGYAAAMLKSRLLALKVTMSLMAGLLCYVAVGHLTAAFATRTVAIAVAVFVGILFFVVTIVASSGLLFVSMSLLAPMAVHNCEAVADWLRLAVWPAAPVWLGIVLFCAAVGLAGVLVWFSQTLAAAVSTVCIVSSTALFVVQLRVVWLETQRADAEDALVMCCSFVPALQSTYDDADNAGSCPLGAELPSFDALFVLLVLLALLVAFRRYRPEGICRCFCPRKREPEIEAQVLIDTDADG